jgi:hypothetical protein
MQLWEYFLSQDKEHDLTDPTTLEQWMPNAAQDCTAIWIEAVQALRSLAPRLKGRRGRPSALTPQEADRIFRSYIDRLRPHVIQESKAADRHEPLRAATYQGVRLYAWIPDNELLNWAASDRHMWAEVFGSMISGDFSPVCESCGKELGLTPKGRRPRAGMCRRCKFQAWYSKQPREKLQERWRRNKANERARDREGG